MELGLALIQDNADFVIDNNGTVEALRGRAADVMRELGIAAINAASESTPQ